MRSLREKEPDFIPQSALQPRQRLPFVREQVLEGMQAMGTAYVEFGMNAFDDCVYDGHGGRKEASKKTNEAFEREQSELPQLLIYQMVVWSLRQSCIYCKFRTQDWSLPLPFREGEQVRFEGTEQDGGTRGK